METMRNNLAKLEMLGRETMDLVTGDMICDKVTRHRDQLTACQRQFRLANVKVSVNPGERRGVGYTKPENIYTILNIINEL